MPNRDGFFDNDRESAEKAFWSKNPCMTNCRAPAQITGRARVIGMTPDAQSR
jgi:cytochrome c